MGWKISAQTQKLMASRQTFAHVEICQRGMVAQWEASVRPADDAMCSIRT